MLRTLRRRLTLLCTALTALVLAGALAMTWRMAAAQAENTAATLFGNTFAALCDRLQSAERVTDSWLAAQEVNHQAILSITDNGAPLHFSGAWQPPDDREALLAQAAEAAGPLSGGKRVSFVLKLAPGRCYRGAAACLPRQQACLTVYYLQWEESAAHRSARLAIRYVGLWLLGVAALAAVSWWLAGRALAPTRRALRQQNEFIAAASHELRSPLAVIKASLTAAQAHTLPASERAALLHGAGQEVERMTRLTDDLLLLAGGDAGALAVRCAPLAPDTLCMEVYERYAPLARQQGHPLTLHLPAGEVAVPAVYADGERLRQLLGILLDNALAHTPPGTAVELRLHCNGKRAPVTLAVADHGPGVADADKAHIFERFYRADASRSDKTHFGLGLSVARELARLQNARLTVGDTPGGGATFTVTLPPQGRGTRAHTPHRLPAGP